MSKMNLFFLDNLNNIKEKINIIKPKTFQEFWEYLEEKFKIKPENHEIFILDNNNKEIKVNNNKDYKIINSHLFIRELNKDILKQSIFGNIYINLSESKQDILDEKYNCILCSIIIKNENPYFCYKCQKIYHEKCLKKWDEKSKIQNKNLECPNCRNELPLENWNKKLDYEDTRKAHADLMDKIIEYTKIINMNNIINKIKEEKTNELIKYYENYIGKTIEIFKDILIEVYSIHSLLNLKENYNLNDLINTYPLNLNNLAIDDISKTINEELNNLKIYIQKDNIQNENENIKKNNINLEKINNINNMKNIINENLVNKSRYKNKIDLIYCTKLKGEYTIFGKQFFENNKDNIELIINGKQNPLVDICEFKEGENIISIIINHKLSNLNYMFYNSETLKDITEIKYLEVKDVKNFSYMFYNCSSLSNINPLKNWNVSNAENFMGIFSECTSLSDIKALQNWNVSSCINFSYMFDGCSSLSDINPLKDWNISSGEDFSNMFKGCSSLSDIKPLEKWNIINCSNFSSMFSNCLSLSDLEPLQYWNVAKGKDFSFMFSDCISLKDVKPLKNWNVSEGRNFKGMFSGCSQSLNIQPLKNWNVSKSYNFIRMQRGSSSSFD